MKNLLKFSFIALLSISIFTSCTKQSAERTTSVQYLSATSGTIGSFYSSGTLLTANGATGAKIEIQATSSSGATMYLWLNPYSGTIGVFPLGTTGVVGLEYTTISTAIMSVHGTLTLTSVTPDIIGTFTYTGSDSAVVTGSFDVIAP